MAFTLAELVLLAVAIVLVAAVLFVAVRVAQLARDQADSADDLERRLAERSDAKHLDVLRDLGNGLAALGDRLNAGGVERAEQLRATVDQQLRQTRDALVALQISTNQELAINRETLLANIAELRQGLLAVVAEQRQQQMTQLAELREVLLAQSTEQRAVLLAQLGEQRASVLGLLGEQRESLLGQLGEHRESVLGSLGEMRVEILGKSLAALAEQGRTQSETMQDSVRALSLQLTGSVETLTRTTDARLEQIQGKVSERLEEGFRKTNETFANVMARLATIDEAQRKIDSLTTNVVSLQELLGDKRSRGAFGEVQLENLVRNILPPSAYAFQHVLSNKARADCVLMLPPPTGMVAVDSKFPLENYHRMFDPDLGDAGRAVARKTFRADVKKHVDDIADRYILEGETSDGAVMFIPAEAVFAEIHAYHAEVVDHAMQRRVWIVSPTTMMAVLNTARAVMKDVETRRQVHVIKDELGKLGKDFARFDVRMRKLADHIRQAHDDAQQVQISSDKIVRRFTQIERVELESPGDVARLESDALDLDDVAVLPVPPAPGAPEPGA